MLKQTLFFEKIKCFFPQHIMNNISVLKKDKKVEDNIIKDVRIHFSLKKSF